jgi:class 3 adenylate cyclase/predicted ATPase
MTDIAQWLTSLGLGQYTEAFEENAVGWDVLPHLDHSVLKDLGVRAAGDRIRILTAIESLDADGDKAETIAQPDSPPRPAPSVEAERRQLTVMFCDLVDSTELSERMDPEEFREVIAAYQRAASQAVARFDGYIARYMGDGLLVYFGYPTAHEDDAERAVRAGLQVVDSIDQPDVQGHADLRVRVGIATGLVVAGDIVGEGAAEERAVLGDAPNLAARLQGIAPPNGVVIAQRTRELVEGLFILDSLGSRSLKGISAPVTAYLATGTSDAPSRFEAAAALGLTPLVGRESEIHLLLDRWSLAKDGEGQVVLLSGEAGVGKSRIVRGFQERVDSELKSRILYFCSPHLQRSPLHPVIDQLERGLRVEQRDAPAEKLDKLESVLGELDLPVPEYAPVLASLLSVPANGRYTTPNLAPEALRRRTFDVLLAVFESIAGRSPVLTVVEDAHWMDPSTEEFLGLLIERIRSSTVLTVITHRPEFSPRWLSHAHVTSHALNRLGRRECMTMVEKVTGGKKLPVQVLDQIVDRTDGIPLFVEELTKTVLDSGILEVGEDRLERAGPQPPLSIPTSLQDAFMSRLDHLGAAKEVAQLAATIGRSFGHELLASVSAATEDELGVALERLLDEGLVYRRGIGSETIYEFKHALVRETAYNSLLKSTRQQYHERIAQRLVALFPETVETQPVLLDHHFSAAGKEEQAMNYWSRAGERAAGQSANAEAVKHFKAGLDLVGRLPAGIDQIELELGLLLKLGPALMAIQGWNAPEVEATYTRAHKLCGQVDLPAQKYAATWGLWMFNQARANHRMGRKLAAELLKLSRENEDSGLVLQAHHANWTTRLYTAELDSAWEHVGRGLSIYTPDEHGQHALTYAGHDPGVCGKAQAAMLLWLKGFADQAVESMTEGLAIAEKLAHAPSTAHALYFSSRLHTMRREPEVVLARVDDMARIAEDVGLALYRRAGVLIRAWALAELATGPADLPELSEALAALGTVGWGSAGPHNSSLIARACHKHGRIEEGLKLVDDALDILNRTGERYWEAEVNRLKGELLLREPSPRAPESESESLIRKALDIARTQGARALELRAATSLANLWLKQDKRKEARDLLSPIFEWFTEGLGTPDLDDAKRLLEKLA